MVYAIFQISSYLSDSHGCLLVSRSGFDHCLQMPALSVSHCSALLPNFHKFSVLAVTTVIVFSALMPSDG